MNPTPRAPAFENILSSDKLQVDRFHQILWLPLRCRGAVNPGEPDSLGNVRWTQMAGDPLLADDLGGPRARDDAYAHYLYFHPYIRRFLFRHQGRVNDAEAGLRIWTLAGRGGEQDTFARLDVALPIGQARFDAGKPSPDDVQVASLSVERCRLYQFPGTAPQGLLMLELELAWQRGVRSNSGLFDAELPGDLIDMPLTLADVLDLLDVLRRTHPGYFPKSEAGPPSALHLGGGRYPLAMSWRGSGQSLLKPDLSARALGARKAALQDSAFQRASSSGKQDRSGDAAPLDAPWQELLGPGLADGAVAQIEDERMPLMAYVAMPNPQCISKGDWVRLAFCDYRGNSDRAPYADGFCADFEPRFCYDRYYQPPEWTRYLNTGFASVMVGGSGKPNRPSFFDSDGLIHFRRHYASMGLLAQFNKAALLTFSGRLNEAILRRSRGDPASDEGYRVDVRRILADLLEFTHRHWFDGVSNQLQAGEMYEYWVKHLRLRELYQNVMAEARSAHEFVVTQEEARQTAAVNRLTTYGLWFAAVSVVLGLAGAGFPVDKPLSLWLEATSTLCSAAQPDCALSLSRLAAVAGWLGVVAFAAAIVVWRLMKRTKP